MSLLITSSDGNDGKAFERFATTQSLPEYAGQFEKVWLWNDWPDKWSIDKGIDIIAKYKNSDKFVQYRLSATRHVKPFHMVKLLIF